MPAFAQATDQPPEQAPAADAGGRDVVVITAGVPRKKDPVTGKFTSRDELVEINRKIVGGVTREIASRSPRASTMACRTRSPNSVWLSKA